MKIYNDSEKKSLSNEDIQNVPGSKFVLKMNMDESQIGIEYNEEEQDEITFKNIQNEEKWRYAVTVDNRPYLNDAGLGLVLSDADIENNVYQQFIFGQDSWSTVIDSYAKKGMVWDIADENNLDPPPGTPFYLFPFHGRHNQHFLLQDGKIIAKQNGMAVTYMGGKNPFRMMPLSPKLKERQTFKVQLL
ncbi:hypothetical protein M9Y10_015672 [Tritrichomonas musculus]|uniref:Uncharacterized protein n=1 Tax=Tritrichomonas musculus TaxID=1915356 RepID=A0ABR2L4N9_9EUKA